MNELHDEILRIVYKHLPGKHDQKTHGRNRGVSDNSVEEESPVPVFHGTGPDFAESIKSSGLKRGREYLGRPPSVYFTSDLEAAKDYGNVLGRLGDEFAVIEFSIPKNYSSKIIPDDADLLAFGIKNSFRIEQDIPKEWIRDIKIYNVRTGEVSTMKESEKYYYSVVVLSKELS